MHVFPNPVICINTFDTSELNYIDFLIYRQLECIVSNN